MLRRLMRETDVCLRLQSSASRLALILLAAIPGALLGFQAARMAMAARLGSRLDVAGLRRAIALDPGNAGYEHQLGLIDAYSFGPANFPEAVKHLRRATELNPRKAQYWSDLAEVCDTTGDAACSHQAAERALKLSPATPRFEWKAANHFLQAGRVDDALRHFRRLLALDDSYAQPVFQVCLRVTRDPQTVYQKVLPAGRQPRLQLAYLDFVSAQGKIDFANSLWARISSDGVACRFEDVRPYVENLFASGHRRRAAAVWRQLERAGVIPGSAEDRAANLVYNGRFSHPPLDAVFDWQARNVPYVETDFHDPSAFRGGRCLRVDYAAGGNLESEPVYEFVPVVPGRAYRLRAEVRSENITSASGPRLRVTDPDCTACLNTATQTTVGTTPWHPVALDFAAGAHARVVRLSVWRARSRTFPMEISGSFWLDDVSITPLKFCAEGDSFSKMTMATPAVTTTSLPVSAEWQDARSRASSLVFRLTRRGLVAILLAAPLAFGAVEPWAWAALLIASFVLLMLWTIGSVRQGELKVQLSPLYLPAVLFLVLCIVQLYGGVTLDAYATRESIFKLVMVLVIFFIAGQVFARASDDAWSELGLVITLYAFVLGLFAILQFFSSHNLIYWSVTKPRLDLWALRQPQRLRRADGDAHPHHRGVCSFAPAHGPPAAAAGLRAFGPCGLGAAFRFARRLCFIAG